MAANANVDSTPGRLAMKTDGTQPTTVGQGPQPKAQKSTHTTPSTNSKTSSKGDDSLADCEFAIAADLTLYANPLRCLRKTAKPAVLHDPSSGPTEMIAADLVKYGSPLDDNPN
ncbi:hypothetical protein ACOMHN_050094 [Nucella lapillus]